MKKTLSIIFLILLIGTTLGGCGKKQQPMDLYDVIKQRGTLVVGVRNNIKPFGYLNENKEYQGLEIDLAKNIAKMILNDEKKIEFVPVDTSSKIAILNSGQADMVIALMTITPQRAEIVDFSEPYYTAGQTVMVKKTKKINTLSDLNTKKVGIVFGTTADKAIRVIAPTAAISGYKTYENAIEALNLEEIDAIALDDTILLGFAMDNPDLKILPQRYSKEPYGIAMRKGIESTRMLEMINSMLLNMSKDGSLNRLKTKWIK